MITKYFGNGKKWKVNIEYIVEEQPLGTAGCLKLLSKSKIKDLPFIITNSDLVTEIEFKKILNYHSESKSKATICLSQYDMMIPFGVAKLKKNLLEKIVEKPVEKFFVNAGIYVLEPSVLDNLENFDEKFDMTRVLDHIVSNGDNVHAFPIYEYWMDVGQLSEFKLVSQKYKGE